MAKKNDFGKCTQEATKRAIAKEMKIDKKVIEMYQAGTTFTEGIDTPMWCVGYCVTLPDILIHYTCTAMVFGTENVAITNIKLSSAEY